MKVPTLLLYSTFVIIDKNGNKTELHDVIITGCFQMCLHLEKCFGIKTVPSTVFNGNKKFIPNHFTGGRTKEYYLAYFNWVINHSKEQKKYYFEDEVNKKQFYLNNPFVDFYIIVKRKNNLNH
jgi:hypothetical protein